MEKCSECCYGTCKELYYDYGCEDLISEDCLKTDKNFLKSKECITLYNFCPYCGHRNNLEKFRGFTRYVLEDYIITGNV